MSIPPPDENKSLFASWFNSETADDAAKTASNAAHKIHDLGRTAFCILKDLSAGKLSDVPIATSSKWMNTGTALKIFEDIQTKRPETTVNHSFFMRPINEMDWNDIQSSFEFLKGSSEPIFIPIIVRGAVLFEGQHIMSLLIKEGKIIFSDSKGFAAKEYKLEDGHTLEDVLKEAQKLFGGEIVENTKKYQKDCHNCGVYVGLMAYRMIVDNYSLEEFQNEMLNTKSPRTLIKTLIPSLND